MAERNSWAASEGTGCRGPGQASCPRRRRMGLAHADGHDQAGQQGAHGEAGIAPRPVMRGLRPGRSDSGPTWPTGRPPRTNSRGSSPQARASLRLLTSPGLAAGGHGRRRPGRGRAARGEARPGRRPGRPGAGPCNSIRRPLARALPTRVNPSKRATFAPRSPILPPGAIFKHLADAVRPLPLADRPSW